ncbi:hypothetical protein BS47DRAFT_1487972 [Hydnum rufescens UP504]|uniref:Uncharacterized protein n=1 Tax=Hydnum rufescens UP504 TaxID=1448309 RepID=A0A9P6DSE0_9AGAM|nr:hypothetical protein BS47DRAFT_1487972 [Hydnum rufescens UP504]
MGAPSLLFPPSAPARICHQTTQIPDLSRESHGIMFSANMAISPPDESERRVLLSTCIKWVNVFPRDQVSATSQRARTRSSSVERRTNYSPRTCKEMPPFPERESALLSRPHANFCQARRYGLTSGTLDHRCQRGEQWKREASKKLGTIRRYPQTENTTHFPTSGHPAAPPELIPDISQGTSITATEVDILSSLAASGLNMTSTPTTASSGDALSALGVPFQNRRLPR